MNLVQQHARFALSAQFGESAEGLPNELDRLVAFGVALQLSKGKEARKRSGDEMQRLSCDGPKSGDRQPSDWRLHVPR